MKALTDCLQVVVLSVVSLLTLFLVSRLGGKRQIAQMSMFDYINSISIGSISAEMATNLEEWYKPFAALLVYGLLAWFVRWLACKSIRARLLICGDTIALMEHGNIYKKELARAGISLNEFLAQSRVAGYFDLNELESALLETSGRISFLPKSENAPVTAKDLALHPDSASTWIDLIVDGRLMKENLHISGKDMIWLQAQLSRCGIGQIHEVFYAACNKQNDFFACRGE